MNIESMVLHVCSLVGCVTSSMQERATQNDSLGRLSFVSLFPLVESPSKQLELGDKSGGCWRSSKLPYIEGNLHWAIVELNAINRTALFTVVAVV
jgi:hypothetical protein